MSSLGFKEWEILFMLAEGICVTHSPRLTPGVTPANLLVASMAAETISSVYLQAVIGGAGNQDLSRYSKINLSRRDFIRYNSNKAYILRLL